MKRTLPAAVLVIAVTALAGCSNERSAPAPAASTTAVTRTTDVTRTTGVTSPAGSTTLATSSATAGVPPISTKARAAGLHDVRTVVPDARIDLRYATRDNFTKVRLYPRDARCLVHTSMMAGLAEAGRAARKAGLVLVFWDCYRPHAVQVRMFRAVPDPAFVARPGPYARSHEAGRSVDVTLARRGSGTLLDMGTGFDSFSPRASAYATSGVSADAERNRALLRKIMRTGRLGVYTGEWWHFDGRGAGTNRPRLDAPVR